MASINAKSGRVISEDEELRQSVQRLLTTPIGTRALQRDYGSRISEFLDRPADAALEGLVLGAVSEALRRWEPRLTLESGRLVQDGAAHRLELDLRRTADGTRFPVSLAEGIA